MNLYHLKAKAAQLADELNQAKTEFNSVLKELQSKCTHPHESVIEAPYYSGSFVFLDDIRLCTFCGTQETRPCGGWKEIINQTGEYGQGTPFRQVTRDDLHDTRYKLFQE